MRYAGGLMCMVAMLASASVATANDNVALPYTFEEALTEEQVWDMGGNVRLLSPRRALTRKGCFDLSVDPPVQLDELGFESRFALGYWPNGATVYKGVEGADHLLVKARDYDRDRRQWTVMIARVGCVEPQILHKRTYTEDEPRDLHIADLYPSVSRPLTVYDRDGLSRLDVSATEEAEPVPWLSGERLWQGVLDMYGGELPTQIAQNGEVEEYIYTGTSIHPLGPGEYLAQLSFSLRFAGNDRFESFSWVVRMDEDGAMQALFEPEEHVTDAEIRLGPEHGVFFFGGLAVPLRDEPAYVLRAQASPVDFHYRNMFSYDPDNRAKKLVLDNTGRYVFDRFVLTTNEELVDFDRDGVPLLRERELGTSDVNQDSDGDGVDDGVELFFERDPAVPQATASEERLGALGFSNMIMEWAPMRDLSSHFFYPFVPSARVLCQFPIGAARVGWNGPCYDHNLEEIDRFELGKNQPMFVSDEQIYLERTAERVNIYTKESVPETVDTGGRILLGFNHDGGIIMAETGTQLDRAQILYQNLPGGPVTTLSLSSTPVDKQSVAWASYIGHARDGALDFFGVDTFIASTPSGYRYNERWLYAMRGERAVGLFEMRGLLIEAGLSPDIAEEHTFGAIANVEQVGGYVLRIDEINTRKSIYFTLDEQLGVTSANAMPRMEIGAWWREGLMGRGTYRHRVAIGNNASPSSRCVNLGGVIACDAEPGMIYMASAEIDESVYRQIVPLTAGLGPSDALMSVHQRGLWRHTPEGAVSPWLTEARIERMRLEAGITKPVDDFRRLSLRRDRRAVCAISKGNLYTIDLDERGVPLRLHLIDQAQGEASACAWDPSTRQVVWSDTAGKVFAGERELRFDAGKQVETLISLTDGRWIVADSFWAMRCVDATGQELGVTGTVMGAALFDEELLYVDEEFSGPGILSVDELCSGEPVKPAPLLDSAPGAQFWTRVYREVQGSILGSHGVSPKYTGVAVLARDQVLVTAIETHTSAFVGTVAPVPIRIRPDYPDVSEQTAQILGEKPYHTGMISRASEFNVLAMASAPNANLDRSTSYYEQPELPEVPTPQAPEMQDEEGGEQSEAPGGCAGCSSAPGQGSAPLWLLGLLFLARRRRRA